MSLLMRSRFYAHALRCAARVASRRAMRGPALPGWSFLLETTVEALRTQQERILSLADEAHRSHQASIAMPMPMRGITRKRVSLRGVRCEWIIPRGTENGPVLLYLHGGGYVIGSIETHGALVASLARKARVRVLFPEYRLSPEHPHPAALEDAVGVYLSLLAQGVEPSRIMLAGDSAGGGLSLATMLKLRDDGDPLPAGALLICPWVDVEGRFPSAGPGKTTDWGDRNMLEYYATRYIPKGDRAAPLVSPINADLHGLPRMMAQVGDAEMLIDEVRAFHEKATAAGTDVELRVWPGMVHDWHMFAPLVREATQAIDEGAAFIRDVFHGVKR